MPSILDLPRETLELIHAHLISTPTQWLHVHYPNDLAARTTACLRLVCWRWAEWLYVNHLYHGLKFDNASRSNEFIAYQRSRSELLPHAKCQHLVIGRIWTTREAPTGDVGLQDMITSEILENLLDLFPTTILTLDLQFVDHPSLPIGNIQAIKRIESLRELHLNLSPTSVGNQPPTPTDPEFFNALIVAAQGINSLVLGIPISLDYEPEPGMWGDRPYPAITHLHVNMLFQRTIDILRLSIAFKPSLKVLSVQANEQEGREDLIDRLFQLGFTHEGFENLGVRMSRIGRVYELLKESLEGLSISSSHIL
ncbi:hypothetical protein PGT21_027577 [Puccinia graminis f. sp. tritici]|uniref:F-box domain-containing protein n=1 Tax=Puccinia graminis f. sp. tritici TaxID=56615 RepID=A0A5B0N585_PUCGR|nr:hypothetical protein PGT21_027577 [Puccinia graminis f. sp. tritici]KAA1132968.1 hypothetical protein PGTUg99_014974 [Puccinia graminis f. sp. tritici]